MPTEDFARLRDLGNLEKYSSTRHALGLYNNVSVSAYYAKPQGTQRPSLVPLIHSALATVVGQNPVLSAIPVEEDQPTAHFLRLPNVNLQKAVVFVERKQPFKHGDVSDYELDRLLGSQHNTNFKAGLGDSPFWRLIILHHPGDDQAFVAAFVFHHALADGRSGLAFHRKFHQALLAADTVPALPSEQLQLVLPQETDLVPSLEQLHPLPFTIWFVLRFLWRMLFPAKADRLWTGRPIDFSYQKRRIRTAVIPQDRTAALLKASRAHGVSVTAVVPAVLARAIFSNLPAAEAETLRAGMPVSLRHCLPSATVTEDTMGVYVSQAEVTYTRSEFAPPTEKGVSRDFIWAAAQRTKAALVEAVSRDGTNDVVGLLRWAGPLKAYLEQKNGKQPDSSYEFSNLGVFKYATTPPEDGWKVGRVVFGQDGNVVGPAFQTAGATGPDGELTVSFAWLDEQIDEAWIMKVMANFVTELESIIALQS